MPALAEHHTLPHGVGGSVDGARRFRRFRIRVHPNPAEVVPKTRFHKITRRSVERLARRAQHVVHNAWRGVA
jgi:hypothetical protein